jgi:hypothetical protein
VTFWHLEATFIVFLVLAPLTWSLHRAAQARSRAERTHSAFPPRDR